MTTIDSTKDLVLRWEFDPEEVRRCQLYIPHPDGSGEQLKLFYFLAYYYSTECNSTYYRWNLITRRYENAGNIEWITVRNIKLNMGLRSLPVDVMTRRNKPNSRSRRFKAMNNIEYKWRPVESEPANLECVTVAGKKFVALYNAAEQTLRVHPRAHPVLDDIVVLCLVHLYRRSVGFDFVLPNTSTAQASTSAT